MNFILTILAAIFVLFLPGFVISFIFFARRTIDSIERLALSFALSVAVVPLVVFYTNLLGVRITMITVLVQIAWIIIISLAILFGRRLFKPNKK